MGHGAAISLAGLHLTQQDHSLIYRSSSVCVCVSPACVYCVGLITTPEHSSALTFAAVPHSKQTRARSAAARCLNNAEPFIQHVAFF